MTTWLESFAAQVRCFDEAGRRGLEPLLPTYAPYAAENNYWNYPLLFLTPDARLEPEPVAIVAVFARWLSLGVIHADRLLDEASPPTCELLAIMELARRGTELMHRLFPARDAYWDHFRRYSEEYIRAQQRERELQALPMTSPDISDSEYRRVSAGKAALGKSVSTAVALLSLRADALPLFEHSHDALHVGHQRYDDLIDWKEDARRGQRSWLLWRAATAALARGELIDEGGGAAAAENEYRRRVHADGLSIRFLQEGEQSVQDALTHVRTLSVPRWVEYLEEERRRMASLRESLQQIVASQAGTRTGREHEAARS